MTRDHSQAVDRAPDRNRDRREPEPRVQWEAGTHHDAGPTVEHLEDGRPFLPAPELTTRSGSALAHLSWTPVPGAAGYLVERADREEGPYSVLDHGGGDVLAFPGTAYADTTGLLGHTYWYRIRPVRSLDTPPETQGLASIPRSCRVDHRPPADPVQVVVHADRKTTPIRPVWHMLGSEHLSQLAYTDLVGGRVIGRDFAQALDIAHRELGLEKVRAHGILSTLAPSPSAADPTEAAKVLDFASLDHAYEEILAMGIRPVVELSFMPPGLARNKDASVFTYPGVTSPPNDFARWGETVENTAAHLVERFGLDEVASWGFEVWNEPNLSVFWQDGTFDDYLELYAEAAQAVRRVSPRLRVGGPASAAAAWLEPLLHAARSRHLPLDFLSTHTYGNLPLNLRPLLDRYGFEDTEIWWTEWGVTPTHFHPVNDLPFAAPFVLHGMKEAQAHTDHLAYWVVSDHFEELGRPPRLLHGGFGLLTVGNLRKPRFWALRLAEELGTDARQVNLFGDGAESLVDAWATRHPDGTVDLLVWNGTLDQSKVSGHPLLDRRLAVRIEGLSQPPSRARLARIDALHTNLARAFSDIGPFDALPDWPDEKGWERLNAADRLDEQDVATTWASGAFLLALDLPMPGVARLRLFP